MAVGEVGVMLPQASWGLLEARKGKEEPFPRNFRRSRALPTPWFRTCSLQNCEMISFCYFKPLICSLLWSPRKQIHLPIRTSPSACLVHFQSLGNSSLPFLHPPPGLSSQVNWFCYKILLTDLRWALWAACWTNFVFSSLDFLLHLWWQWFQTISFSLKASWALLHTAVRRHSTCFRFSAGPLTRH